MLRSVVVDNTTLVYLTKLRHLQIFRSLPLLFSRIHIPGQIKIEYERSLGKEPSRAILLEKLKVDGFYSFCTRYDSLFLDKILKIKGIDKGEAEVAAQHREIGAHYVLSDDKKFSSAIRQINPKVKVFSTLHVIVMLDVHQFIQNREELIREFHSIQRFTSKSLRLVYNEVCDEFGIPINKKDLGIKCSFKKLGLKIK